MFNTSFTGYYSSIFGTPRIQLLTQLLRIMVYSVLNCLYRCYQIPLSRSDPAPLPENDIKREVMICEGCNDRVQGLYIVSCCCCCCCYWSLLALLAITLKVYLQVLLCCCCCFRYNNLK